MSYITIAPIIASWSSIYQKDNDTAIYENIFPTPIMLNPDKNYGIAIDSIDTYYSFPNIKENFNNRFTYTSAGTEHDIYLPTGCYDIETINSTIKSFMGTDSDKITISVVEPQLKSSISIAPGFTVDFTKFNSINHILGFNQRVLNAGNNISDEIVNINKTNSIFVNCDLISESYVNGKPSTVIYTFFPNVAPGYKIVKELPRLNFIKVNKSQINSIKVWLTDQDNDIIDFRGEVITIRFYLGELVSQ